MNLSKAAHLIFGFVLSTFALYGYFVAYRVWPSSDDAIGQMGSFGDTFGVLTSLFSGLAFAGLSITILLQRQELKEAREIFKKQKFEGAFYRLLEFHQHNLKSISIKHNERQGIEALRWLLQNAISASSSSLIYIKRPETAPLYEQTLFLELQRNLTPQARYLGTLESTLRLISEELENYEEKINYLKIFFSQLTSIEKRYIFYQCLIAPQENTTRKLIHESGMASSLFTGIHIAKTHLRLYQRMHSIDLIRAPSTIIRPFTKQQIKTIRREHAQVIQSLREEFIKSNPHHHQNEPD